jgi:hypothetical protein
MEQPDRKRADASVYAAMKRLEGMELRYIPPWEREDRSEPWLEAEPGSHVMMRVGGRLYGVDDVLRPF